MKMGYITLDVPCITGDGIGNPEAMRNDAATALEYVNSAIKENALALSARIRQNAHDFGSYPSIEVYLDCPNPCDEECEEDNECITCANHRNGVENVTILEADYSRHFAGHL